MKAIRCDNAGENKQFEKDATKDNLGLKFEYTAVNTPQQNGRIERKFASLYGRVRAMLNNARVTSYMRAKLWAECAKTATECENLLISNDESESSYEMFYGEKPRYARYLRTFGEIAILANHEKIKGKLNDRGKPALFLGYCLDHADATFRFLNLKTNKAVLSRDVIWLNKNYGDWKGLSKIDTRKITDDNEDIDFGDDYEPKTDTIEVISDEPITNEPNDTVMPSTRLIRELRGLQFNTGAGNPTADEELTRIMDSGTGREETNEPVENAHLVFPNSHFAFIAKETLFNAKETTPAYEEPKSFQEAYHHKDPYQREQWRNAIKKEFGDMLKRGVWKNFKRQDMPKDRRCVKCKWVFKVKRTGVFRARLVACGYSQVPGVDFTENFAPVINDVTWRVMLVMMLVFNLKGVLLDVECAFLEGELEEEVYMDCPEGLIGVDNKVDCLRLEKSIYGLVQSARQWWKKFVKILREIGFEGGYADPCLFTKRDDYGTIFIALYVDDCLCIGDEIAIKNMIEKLRKRDLKLTVDEKLKDYLSCEILFSQDRKKIVLHQPHIIASLKKEFGADVQNLQNYRTPGTPGVGMSRGEGKVTVSAADQSKFRTGVGKLLYLVKHTRPDIANAVRELSKMLDCTTPSALKELRRVIKYVLDTETFGLKIFPDKANQNGILNLKMYCDSDFAGDKETRISISGYIMYLCGVPISWRSKAMRQVTLSSSEAEYVSLSEAAKEVKFVVQLIESMGIKIQKPIEVRVDNLGAIFMANNISTSPRTKHVDVRYRFVNELIEDGLIKVKFVQTDLNQSDGFTKNLNGDLHDKHKEKFIVDKDEIHKIYKNSDDDEFNDEFDTGQESHPIHNRKGVGE